MVIPKQQSCGTAMSRAPNLLHSQTLTNGYVGSDENILLALNGHHSSREKGLIDGRSGAEGVPFPDFSPAIAAAVRRFHASIPDYQPTPLVRLEALAKKINVDKVWVKDESKRFGLNAFKVLGSSYAIAKKAREKAGRRDTDGDVNDRCDCSWKEMSSEMSGSPLITATDGNHGYGVSWIASQLPAPCRVLMPRGSALARVERTRKLGADVQVTDVGYDETVEEAVKTASSNDWLLVQDTSFEGYEEIPLDIMQGYMTIFHETMEQIDEMPTHVFLQAGVGSFAGGLLAFFRNYEAELSSKSSEKISPAVVTIVEAAGAECLFKSSMRKDGKPEIMTTPCDTIMAGLNCSSPCTIAWPILERAADAFLCCNDDVAACGMKLAFRPYENDPQIISGESGAVTLGAIYKICTEENHAAIREKLGMNENSRILVFSTEGDTDPEGFQRIVSAESMYP